MISRLPLFIVYTVSTFFVFVLHSCTWDQLRPSTCDVLPLIVQIENNEGASCNGIGGRFELSVSGGEEPYSFELGIESNTDGVFSSLQAGIYNVTVIDNQGCSVEEEVTVLNSVGVNLDELVISDVGCESANGSLEVIVSGGEQPYIYKLNDGEGQASNVFSNLDVGTYTLTVSDQDGCDLIQSISLETVTYENSIKSIIETNCAISGCHVSGSVSPDFTSFDNIEFNASEIKTVTESRYMPTRGRSLTDEEITLIACWVDQGAPNN